MKTATEKRFITNRNSPLVRSKVRKLEAQYIGNNTFWNDKVKQILTENEDIDKSKLSGLLDQCVIIYMLDFRLMN